MAETIGIRCIRFADSEVRSITIAKSTMDTLLNRANDNNAKALSSVISMKVYLFAFFISNKVSTINAYCAFVSFSTVIAM